MIAHIYSSIDGKVKLQTAKVARARKTSRNVKKVERPEGIIRLDSDGGT